MRSSEGRAVAGMGAAVRANRGRLTADDFSKGRQKIEFYTFEPPSSEHPANGPRWNIDEGEMLPIELSRVWDGADDALYIFEAHLRD